MSLEKQSGLKVVRKKDLHTRIGLRRTAVEELVKLGDFPRPIRVGKRAVAWLESEIDEWLRARAAERDDK